MNKKYHKKNLKKMSNFKSPRPVGISNFRLKQLHSLHNHYTRVFSEHIKEENVMDECLTEG